MSYSLNSLKGGYIEDYIYILGGPLNPGIVTIGDNRDDIRVLLYSYYTTITGWGVLLIYIYGFQVVPG